MMHTTLRTIAIASLSAGLLIGCGEDAAPKDKTTPAATTQDNDDNNNNNNTSTAEQLCTDICNKQNTCMTTVCPAGADVQSCVEGCVADGTDQETRDSFVDAACEAIVQVNCQQSQAVQDACTCPEVGECPEGQSCVPLQDGDTVCAEGNGAPADALVCGATACPEGDYTCVAFSAGAANGFCLAGC